MVAAWTPSASTVRSGLPTPYRFDGSYALEVHKASGRFGLIKPFNPTEPGVAEAVADWAAKDGVVGARIMLNRPEASPDAADPGLNQILAAAARHALPVNMLVWGRLEQAKQLAARNPDTSIVIDHLGLQQPFEPPAPAQPFAELPKVLELAAYPNVSIKISGACTLSHQPFPYKDIWDPLAHIFDAFGFDRCMWGTDWTRAVGLLTYKQGVEAFRVTDRLSDSDRAALMGGTLKRIYDWTPSKAVAARSNGGRVASDGQKSPNPSSATSPGAVAGVPRSLRRRAVEAAGDAGDAAGSAHLDYRISMYQPMARVALHKHKAGLPRARGRRPDGDRRQTPRGAQARRDLPAPRR
jgi:predicted TIM-barrel fold metal-dependent hydrolase